MNNRNIIPHWIINSEYINNLKNIESENIKSEYDFYIPDEFYKEDDSINSLEDYKQITEIIGFMNFNDLPKTYIDNTKEEELKYLLKVEKSFVKFLLIKLLDKILISSDDIFILTLELCQKWNIDYFNNFYDYGYNNKLHVIDILKIIYYKKSKDIYFKKIPQNLMNNILIISENLSNCNLEKLKLLLNEKFKNYNIKEPLLHIKFRNLYNIKNLIESLI